MHDYHVNISCVAICTLVSTTMSIIQQIHVIGWYRDVVIEQAEAKLVNPGSPDHAIANGSTGMDLVLFYIQFYCYNVESMFVLFWAAELGQSVYGLTQKYHLMKKLKYFNYAAKASAVLLPLLLVALLRAPAVQNNTAAFVALADLPLWLSIGCGSIVMIAILGRYIHTQRVLLRFDPARAASTVPIRHRAAVGGQSFRGYGVPTSTTAGPISVFQVTVTIFQQFATSGTRGIGNSVAAAYSPGEAPDLSIEQARTAMYFFIPGNTPGIALMIIFGTTATFRHHMYKTFVPKRFQKGCGTAPLPMYDNDNKLPYPLETVTTNSSTKKPVPRNNTGTPVPPCPKRALLKQVSFRSDSAMSSSIGSPTSLTSPVNSPTIGSPTPLLRSDSTKSCMRQAALTPPLRSKSITFRSDTTVPAPSPMHSPTPLARPQSARTSRRTPPPVTRFRSNTAMSSYNRRTSTPRPDLMKTLPKRPPPSLHSASNPIDGLAMGPGVETEWHEDSAAFIIKRIEVRHGVQIDPGSRGGLI
ncbi:hypothetical protein PG994_002723 [Apiospora phragmitis]|uniref:Pheromone receptor n=1 Tax=Apiospora phragmitis TaxID=2905665 RepID=A0ABR1W5Y3_9PEZI